MQGDGILAGPVYATQIESARNVPPFEAASKKGLIHGGPASVAAGIDMGISNTILNMDLGSLIYRNEDSNGNPVDNSSLQNVYTFVSNGETFYFDADYVNGVDADISAYSKRGVNVMLVLITWAKTDFNRYPTQLTYNTTDNHQTVAFNTSNDRGLRYWIAALEFLADRYSKSADSGLVEKYIIGNEVDYCYDWYLIQPETDGHGHRLRADLDTFFGIEYAEQGDNYHDRTVDRDGEGKRSLGVDRVRVLRELGQQDDKSRVHENISKCLEDLLDVSEKASLIGVRGDQADHGVERNQHSGQADSVRDVVDQEYIDILDHVREACRNVEQEHGGDCKRNAHSQEPDSGFAHLSLGLIDYAAHDQV